MSLGASTKLLNSNREFQVGDRVAERPSRPFVTNFNTSFNAQASKLGEIIELEIRKQRSRTAKKGYSERRWANVKWDIRSRPEWVVETRLVHENELESHELLTRLEA